MHDAALQEQFERLSLRLEWMGGGPAVCVGAGRTLEAIRPTLRSPRDLFIGVVDDDARRRGDVFAGLPVMSLSDAVEAGAKSAVITAAGAAQDAMWAKRRRLRDAGMHVFCCPARFPTVEWDAPLIHHYEWRLARSRGLERPYTATYPKADEEADAYVLEMIDALGAPRDGVYCEIGSGAGRWTGSLLERASHVYAVDRSERLLYEAMEDRFAKQLDRLTLLHDATGALAGAPDERVDVVFSYGVFVHIKIDFANRFLRSIARVLRPGGAALLQFIPWGAHAVEMAPTRAADRSPDQADCMQYVHPEWLAMSAEHCGLRIASMREAKGAWLFVEFRKR